MKRFACLWVVVMLACAGGAPAVAEAELKTEDDKTFYALGLVISRQLAAFKLTPAELAAVQAGLLDGSTGKTPKVSLDEYGPKIQALGEKRVAAGVTDEKKRGKEYLAKISEKPGIKKVGSGLLMETVSEGTGESPKPEDNVKVNYKGALIDGHVFDESARHGGPSTFKLTTGLVKCWNEGLTYMKVGGKAKLYCPAELAYGDRPNGEIPAGATLVFDIELLEIVK